MRRLLGALLALVIWSLPALAADQGFVVAVCGTPTGQTYTIPGFGPITIDQNGNLCVNTGGGGGGGGAVFGPTAAGSPAANPPVLIGGTSDGTATGNVTNWKVVSGIGYLNLAQVNAITVLTGAGATGTGSQRVTVAQDATTVAGLPPGQALAAASAPVVLTAAQLSTLTPPTSVTANGAANVTATDCSGTVTSGGTAQNAFTAQTTLHGFTIANIDTTEPLWISFTTTAAAAGAGSYPLPAATATTYAGFGSFTAPPGFGLNHALSVIAATTSHKFTCTWW